MSSNLNSFDSCSSFNYLIKKHHWVFVPIIFKYTVVFEFEILFQIECVMCISNLTLDEFNIVSFEESEWLSFTIHYESFHCTNLQKSESHLFRKSHSDLIRVVYWILMVDFYVWGVMFELSCCWGLQNLAAMRFLEE